MFYCVVNSIRNGVTFYDYRIVPLLLQIKIILDEILVCFLDLSV
jgi:hypothetical protein